MMIMNEGLDADFDIKRSVILGAYIHAWGLPASRLTFTGESKGRVEVYLFPSKTGSLVSRIATVSSRRDWSGNAVHGAEFLFVLPTDLVHSIFDEVANLIVAIVSRTHEHGHAAKVGELFRIADGLLKSWPMRNVVSDLLLGEPDEVSSFQIGAEHIHLWWLVPVYDSEADLIRKEGVEALDELKEHAELSVVDVRRSPLL